MYKHTNRNRQKKKSSRASRIRRYHRMHNQQFDGVEDRIGEGLLQGAYDQEDEHYFLKDHAYGAFLPIETHEGSYYKGPFPSYGGAQIWWSTKEFRDSTGNSYGCGVIAAANLIIYLASHFKAYLGLVGGPYRALTQESYMMVANELWDDIKPYSGFEGFEYHIGRNPYTKAYRFGFGVTVPKLLKGIEAYASRRGISIEFMTIKAKNATDQQGANFVKLGLLRNYPVLLLSLNNGIDKYEYHWVLITELVEEKQKDKRLMTISTWGEVQRDVDFNELWNFGAFMENQYMIGLV